MTLSVDINRNHHNEKTSGRIAHADGHSVSRTRRIVAAVGMIAPLTAFLAAAAWYLTV